MTVQSMFKLTFRQSVHGLYLQRTEFQFRLLKLMQQTVAEPNVLGHILALKRVVAFRG